MLARLNVTALLVAVAALGCSKDAGDIGGVPVNGTCTVTLAGSQTTGGATCTAAGTAWASANNQGAITFTMTGNPTVTAAIGFPGEPAAGTYSSAMTGAVGGISITSGANVWLASVGSGQTPQGSYTVTLTSVTNATTVPNGKTYQAHGTLTATAPAVPGVGSGSVTVTVTF